MPTTGYIMVHSGYEGLEKDREWMGDFGCTEIIEERPEHEKLRPRWKALLKALGRNDVLVISRLSNVVESTSELAFFLEYCRREVIRIISIHDELDSDDVVFPAKPTSEIFNIIAAIPEEVASIKNASRRRTKIKKISADTKIDIADRDKRDESIVKLYKTGIPVNEIWKMSGFKSRSSVFRILREKGIAACRYADRRKANGGKPASEE